MLRRKLIKISKRLMLKPRSSKLTLMQLQMQQPRKQRRTRLKPRLMPKLRLKKIRRLQMTL